MAIFIAESRRTSPRFTKASTRRGFIGVSSRDGKLQGGTGRQLCMNLVKASTTLVYDGECGMCKNAVAYLDARLGRGELQFKPCQSMAEELVALGEPTNRCMKEALLVVRRQDGSTQVLGGAAAVNGALRRLRSPRALGLRAVGYLYLVPGFGWVERRVYRWVAKNRHRHLFRRLGRQS